MLDPSGFEVVQRFLGQSIAIHGNVGHSLCSRTLLSHIHTFISYNVVLAKPGVQLMATGAHTMQEITCAACSTYLGWKIVRAHEVSESWKDGHSLLELEKLYLQTDSLGVLDDSTQPRRTSSSGSDSDYGF